MPKPKAKKPSPKKHKAPRQTVMADDTGESFDLSIPEIDAAADAHLRAKKREADGKIALHEKVITAYQELDARMAANLDKLPADRTYRYTAYDNKRKTVQYGKPKITIRNAKASKKASNKLEAPERTKETETINPGAGETLPSLE